MKSYTNKQIFDALAAAERPVFVADERLDGDSLGASLAMADWMNTRGVRVPVLVSGPIPEKYSRLPLMHQTTQDIDVLEEADVIVFFDCSSTSYFEKLEQHFRGATVINIDHHATNSAYGDINQIDKNAAATAIVVYEFFEELRIPISRDAATLLLTGICFDTNVFQNRATNAEAFEVASRLLMSGARVQSIISLLFQNRSVNALKLWGRALERLREHPGKFITTYLTLEDMKECKVSEEESDGLSNFISLVVDYPTLIWFRELETGSVKASMRSMTKDVGAVVQSFGGGGHEKAGGFELQNARILATETGWQIENHPDTYDKIKKLLEAQV